MSADDAGPAPGLFGKLPTLGDFVRRRLPMSFVDPWDAWLQAGVARSRGDLGDAWLPAYLTSPIWRFALSPGLCGETGAAGVLVPSVDAANRHFPLSVVALLPASTRPFAIAAAAERWFGECEELALVCLDIGFLPGGLDARLEGVGPPPAPTPPAETRGDGRLAADGAWAVDVTTGAAPFEALLAAAADRYAATVLGSFSLWWTAGSDHVPPGVSVWPGLPPAESFAALLCDPTTPPTEAATASDRETAG